MPNFKANFFPLAMNLNPKIWNHLEYPSPLSLKECSSFIKRGRGALLTVCLLQTSFLFQDGCRRSKQGE